MPTAVKHKYKRHIMNSLWSNQFYLNIQLVLWTWLNLNRNHLNSLIKVNIAICDNNNLTEFTHTRSWGYSTRESLYVVVQAFQTAEKLTNKFLSMSQPWTEQMIAIITQTTVYVRNRTHDFLLALTTRPIGLSNSVVFFFTYFLGLSLLLKGMRFFMVEGSRVTRPAIHEK